MSHLTVCVPHAQGFARRRFARRLDRGDVHHLAGDGAHSSRRHARRVAAAAAAGNCARQIFASDIRTTDEGRTSDRSNDRLSCCFLHLGFMRNNEHVEQRYVLEQLAYPA